MNEKDLTWYIIVVTSQFFYFFRSFFWRRKGKHKLLSRLSDLYEGLKIWGCQYWCGGHNLLLLVQIGFPDLSKSGSAMAPTGHGTHRDDTQVWIGLIWVGLSWFGLVHGFLVISITYLNCIHCKYLNARFECNDIVIFIYSHYRPSWCKCKIIWY